MTTTAPLSNDQYTAQQHASQQQYTAPQYAAGQPGYQYPVEADRGRGLAITSLVLGILSVVSSWTFFAPIIGLICGITALRQKTTERTMALWGVWLNAVMLAFTVLAVTVFVALLSMGLIGGAFVFPWFG